MHSPIKGQRTKVIVLIAIIICNCCLGNLSQTSLNAMFSSIAPDFGVEVGVGQLMTTLYMLVLGITVPVVTYLMRRFSVKQLMLISIGLLCAGSIVDMLAWDFALFIVGRVLQAVSAGIMMPMMMSVIMISFPPGQQATVMGIAGIALGFAPNIGPTIGGWVVIEFGWRMFFVLLLAASLLLILATVTLIDSEKSPHQDARFDILSFIFSSIALCCLLMGFTNVSNYEFHHPFIWIPLILGAGVLWLFVRRQKRIAHPLIHMEIFNSEHYRVGFWSLNLLSGCFMGITLILPLFVEGCWGGTALQAGMALLPGTIAALILNPLAGILTDKVGERPVVIVGSLCLAVGSVWMIFVYEGMPFWLLLLMQSVRASGVSLLMSPLTTFSMATLPKDIVVDGSSWSSSIRQACASLGTAMMVFAITLGPTLGSVEFGYQLAFGVSALFAVALAILNFVKIR